METNSKVQRFISVLLIFIIMTELPGCVSTKEFVQINEIPYKKDMSEHTHSSDYAYMVWGPSTHHFPKYKSIYYVQNISISDGYLTAGIAEYSRAWNVVSIYVKSDSLIRYTSQNSIKIALNDIDIVQVERTNWYRFWAYTAIGILTISILLVLIFPDVNTGFQL
jgi:hypothetical protein